MLSSKLSAHGLLDLATSVASEHDCSVDEMHVAARKALAELLRSRGWSETNARRLLGLEIAAREAPAPSVEPEPWTPPEPRDPDPDFDDDAGPIVTASPSRTRTSRRKIQAWKNPASEIPPAPKSEPRPIDEGARVDDDEEHEGAVAAEIVPLARGQVRQTVGGKLLRLIVLRSGGGARDVTVKYLESGKVLDLDRGGLERLRVVPANELPQERSPFAHLPVWQRPRMVEGPGDRYDCIHEGYCLTRLLDTNSRASAAHCPKWCKFLDRGAEQRRAEASASSRGRFD